jgi:uncharacterized protein (DUF58 family)
MTTYLDPDVLARVRVLELAAKRVVEGVLAGAHKSPRHGFAVEFAQHREYVPGDDVKHLDWKVFGRTERYYLKQYDLETDLTAWLVVDASGSMRYTSGKTSKYDFACLLAASLAHLVLSQSDRVGLAVVDSQLRRFLRAGGQGGHIAEIIRSLAAGAGKEESRLGAVLHELAGRIGRRGVVLVFSDFLDDPAEAIEGVRRLRFDRHEVIAVRVIDPAEEDFPFASATLFRGLELPQELLTDPRGLRKAYREEFAAHYLALASGLRGLDADLLEVRTDADPGRTLAQFLSERG